jgi:transposase-like protein
VIHKLNQIKTNETTEIKVMRKIIGKVIRKRTRRSDDMSQMYNSERIDEWIVRITGEWHVCVSLGT